MLLDAELLGCYRKRNPVLTGDGKRTEHELLEAFNAQCRLDPTEPPALDLDDLPPLEGRAWDLGRIPPEGEMLELALDIHNLSQGAWPEITEIDDHVLAACLESSRVLGLRFSGVDVRTPDGPFNPVIIEVNGNPGFEYLGRSAPSTVRVIIEKLASRILEDMAE